jgi:hypothetical protein
MEADFASPDVEPDDFVLIHTGSIEHEETGQLFIKGAAAFKFVTDMSGVQGIQGPQGFTPRIRRNETHLQASYDEGQTWSNILPLTDIDGVTPLLRKNNNAVEVSYEEDV